MTQSWCGASSLGPYAGDQNVFTSCFIGTILLAVDILYIPFACGRVYGLQPNRDGWEPLSRSTTPRASLLKSPRKNFARGARRRGHVAVAICAAMAILATVALFTRVARDEISILLSNVAAIVGWAVTGWMLYYENRAGAKFTWWFRLWVLMHGAIRVLPFMDAVQEVRHSLTGEVDAEVTLVMLEFVLSVSVSWIVLFLNSVCHPKVCQKFEMQEMLALQNRAQAYDPSEKISDVTTPEKQAGILSKVTFWWLGPLLAHGYKQPLERSDLYPLYWRDSGVIVSTEFKRMWEHLQVNKVTATVASVLRRMYQSDFWIAALFKFIQDTLLFVDPLVLNHLIKFLQSDTQPLEDGLLLAGILVVEALIRSVSLHQYFFRVFRVGQHLRTAIVTAVYRKSLKLSGVAKQTSTTGEIVNLMSTDAQRMQDLTPYMHMVWSAPYQIALSLIFLYQQLEWSVFGGVAVMILMIPINMVISRIIKRTQSQLMTIKDERIKLTNEILNSMKVLKLYAWEHPFKERLVDVRNQELKILRKYLYINCVLNFLWNVNPLLVSLASFAMYSLSGNELTADKAFTALALFNILRFPISALPMVINNLMEASVSVKRVDRFLAASETEKSSGAKGFDDYVDPFTPGDDYVPPNQIGRVEISNGTFCWDKEENTGYLRDLNITVEPGQLVAIVGLVGSGKSSVLSALLKDMTTVSGSVNVSGKVAYCAQQSWIQNSTLRDNILFGSRYDEDRYVKVLHACQLMPDLDVLPAGDLTEIGEKGINLSGGQKQRVSIARAVYQNRDVYLLDDILSAVDAHVGKSIYKNCISGILKNKTRVLVTHSVQFLTNADKIIVMDKGRVEEIGDYQTLMANKGRLYTFVESLGTEVSSESSEGSEGSPLPSPKMAPLSLPLGKMTASSVSPVAITSGSVGAHTGPSTPLDLSKLQRQLSNSLDGITVDEQTQEKFRKKQQEVEMAQKDQGSLITAEERKVGKVSWGVYKLYGNAIGGAFFVFWILFMFAMAQLFQVGTGWWLSYWSDHRTENSSGYFLSIYAVITALSAAAIMLRLVFMTYGGLLSARNLHVKMLERVMKAPMAFFDSTPIGRILNRFSKDQYSIDERLPSVMNTYVSTVVQVVATVITITSVTPLAMVAFLPLGFLYAWITQYYVSSSRELQRLDSISRSPIYAHFGETIAGASTIRAYDKEIDFVRENENKLDQNQRAYFLTTSSNRWLAMRLECIGTIIVGCSALFAVLAKGSVSPSLAGLSVSYALNITQTLNWLVRMSSQRETEIVSVERIQEYLQLDQEAADVIESRRPANSWPSSGALKFDNLTFKYKPDQEAVLKNLTFDVKGGEKVGIVGRTGAGKSSLMLAVFRTVEHAGGRIFLDDVDISSIGLLDLRSNVSIIPQDPALFSGTVRYNLDPFNEHQDAKLWEALNLVRLKEAISALPVGLDSTVAEAGDNFSAGQKQLLCMARALLRKTKLMVLDEATAAVDFETDKMIQETLRVAFKNCTVLTVAHRINTIIDSDRILVLEKGRIAEYDSPDALIAAKGAFASLVRESAQGQ
eukprot:GFYU01004901.1.p1 GENE.GFYU01004901.1~~GFYU01004901.1.p1  ORF type:complete len:1550 (+),score=481.01 GFYU01004901.1:223-4872(+)